LFIQTQKGVDNMIGLIKRESLEDESPAETIYQWLIECPETDKLAEVEISARAATFTTARQVLLRNCTFWPERDGCQQRCLTSHSIGFD
jgi:hypothetical protein